MFVKRKWSKVSHKRRKLRRRRRRKTRPIDDGVVLIAGDVTD